MKLINKICGMTVHKKLKSRQNYTMLFRDAYKIGKTLK